MRERLTPRDPPAPFIQAHSTGIVHANVKDCLLESRGARILEKRGDNSRTEASALIARVDCDEPKVGGIRRVISVAGSGRRQMSERCYTLTVLNDSPRYPRTNELPPAPVTRIGGWRAPIPIVHCTPP
jgi:hypothetical protein